MKKIIPLSLILGLIIVFLVSANQRDYTFIYTGKIITADGVPLAGTKIQLGRADLSADDPFYTVSGHDGFFKFQLNAFENQELEFFLEKQGFESDTIEDIISRKAKTNVSLGVIELKAIKKTEASSPPTPSDALTQVLEE